MTVQESDYLSGQAPGPERTRRHFGVRRTVILASGPLAVWALLAVNSPQSNHEGERKLEPTTTSTTLLEPNPRGNTEVGVEGSSSTCSRYFQGEKVPPLEPHQKLENRGLLPDGSISVCVTNWPTTSTMPSKHNSLEL